MRYWKHFEHGDKALGFFLLRGLGKGFIQCTFSNTFNAVSLQVSQQRTALVLTSVRWATSWWHIQGRSLALTPTRGPLWRRQSRGSWHPLILSLLLQEFQDLQYPSFIRQLTKEPHTVIIQFMIRVYFNNSSKRAIDQSPWCTISRGDNLIETCYFILSDSPHSLPLLSPPPHNCPHSL